MSNNKTYTGTMSLVDAKPRAKRLQGGVVSVRSVSDVDLSDYLTKTVADALYHPYGGALNLPFRAQNVSFDDTAVADASETADLEVILVEGVRTLHTRLPICSDSSITGGGKGRGGDGDGGSSTLSGLNDVRLTSLSSGQMLLYNGSYWANSAVPSGGAQSDWDELDRTSPAYIKHKPTIHSAPGTLITNRSTGQATSEGESLSGTIYLHKISKTGLYSDLRGKPDLSVYVVNTDLLKYIGKVTKATENDVAVFASGGGLADSGIGKSNLALLSGDQTFTGNNTFQNTVRANSGVVTNGLFLSNLSDAIYANIGVETEAFKPIFRIYTNETSGQGDLNFGVDPGKGGAATHDVNFVGKRIIIRNANYEDSGSTAMVFASDANYIYRDLIPGADRTYDLGSNNGYFKEGHIEDIYVKSFIPWKKQGATIDGDPNPANGGYNFYTIDANDNWNNGLALTPSEAIVGSQLRPGSDGAMSLGLADYRWGNLYARYVKATDSLEAGSIYAYNNAASFDFYIGNGCGGWLKALQLNNTQIEANRNLVPNANQTYDLGANGLRWRYLFANRWYPDGLGGPYIEYDSAETAFKVMGNMYVTGFITGGAKGKNDVQSSISYSLVPTSRAVYDLGSTEREFRNAYFSGTVHALTIGDDSDPVTEVWAQALISDTVTIGTLEVSTSLVLPTHTFTSSQSSGLETALNGNSGSSYNLNNFGLTTTLAAKIFAGEVWVLKTTNYTLRVTGVRKNGSNYTIYCGGFVLAQNSSTSWTVYKTA